MGTARRLRRNAVRSVAKRIGKRHRGPCFVRGCTANGGMKHHCVLCEERGAEYTVQFCDRHAVDAEKAIKRHVLLKHPGTIPSFIVAGLKGEL